MFHSPLILILFLVIGVVLFFLLQRIENQMKENITESDSLVDDFFAVFVLSLQPWIYITLVILAGTFTLDMSFWFHEIRNGLILVLGTIQAIVTITHVGNFIFKHANSAERHERKLLNIFSNLFSFVAWIMGALFVLSNFDIDISALLAGFGIGGIAIAFALQNILRDIFSYLTILLDEPIQVGDIVAVDGREGTVKHIGVKTTRLKATGGEEIVIANSIITSEGLMNYGTAKKRRVSFSLFLEQSITQAKLKKLPEQLKSITDGIEGLTHRSTYIKSIAAAGIEVATIYHVKTRSFELHRNTRTEINLAIHDLFTKEKIALVKADIVANQ